MNCHRCGGVMVYEKFYASHEHFSGWRCILCGDVVDQVILENRHWNKTRERTREEEKRTNNSEGEGREESSNR